MCTMGCYRVKKTSGECLAVIALFLVCNFAFLLVVHCARAHSSKHNPYHLRRRSRALERTYSCILIPQKFITQWANSRQSLAFLHSIVTKIADAHINFSLMLHTSVN